MHQQGRKRPKHYIIPRQRPKKSNLVFHYFSVKIGKIMPCVSNKTIWKISEHIINVENLHFLKMNGLNYTNTASTVICEARIFKIYDIVCKFWGFFVFFFIQYNGFFCFVRELTIFFLVFIFLWFSLCLLHNVLNKILTHLL